MKICVVGLGYVGLPIAVLLAAADHKVVGVDIDESLLQTLRSGCCPTEEPDLENIFQQAHAARRFEFETKPGRAEAFLIAVPTPITELRTADVSYVEAATRSILPVLESGNLVIVVSTIPPGCMENTVKPILESSGLKVGEDLRLAFCPERVVSGKAVQEMRENARVIGGYDEASTQAATELYRSMVKGEIHEVGMLEAELVKLTENAYRDVSIAFANGLAEICEASGVDVRKLTKIANAHPRVNILNSGPGVGGHCIPVDPWFLVEKFPAQTSLLSTARAVNDARPQRIVAQVETLLSERVPSQTKIAALGVTYKPGVADLRHSPGLEIAQGLRDLGYQVDICDPVVASQQRQSELNLVTLNEALSGAHLLLGLVGHSEFKEHDVTSLLAQLEKPALLLDAGGIWAAV